MDFLYRFYNMEPRKLGEHISLWGFCVELDGDFARRIFRILLTEEDYPYLRGTGREIIAAYELNPDSLPSGEPFLFEANEKHFVGEDNLSLLVRSCCVPGNSCGLDIENVVPYLTNEEGEEGKRIIYVPHNVDSVVQRAALISLWTTWLDFADTRLRISNRRS